MGTKITTLTEQQKADLEATLDRWLRVGHCIAPLDRDKAAASVRAMYRAIGKEEPAVLVFSSPMMCILAYGVAMNLSALRSKEMPDPLRDQFWDPLRDQLRDQLRGQLEGQLRDQFWDPLRDQLSGQLEDPLWGQLRDQLRDQLRGQLEGQLRDQFWDPLRDQLSGQLEDPLWGQLRDQLRDQLRGQLEGQLRDQFWDQLEGQLWDQLEGQLEGQLWDQLEGQLEGQLWDQLEGQLSNYFAGPHWCYWYAFYDFCNRVGVQYTDHQRALLNLWLSEGENCHWWFPYDGIVFLSERHDRVFKDRDGRLHCEDGLAVGYPDGWGVYSWHGVTVQADIITNPEAITAARIESEQNAEVRRVMIERMGYERYILESGARLLGTDKFGSLYKKDLPGDESLVMVHVLNSTPEPDGEIKKYMLRVHPELRPMLSDGTVGEPQKMTARNAIASTFGLRGEEYAPSIET